MWTCSSTPPSATSETRPIVFAGPTFRQRKAAIVVESSSNGLGDWAYVCAVAADAMARAMAPVKARQESRVSSGNPANGLQTLTLEHSTFIL